MDEHWDVVVVGGGAAGLSAALMLGRSRRRTLVIDAGLPRNRFAAHMHGVLGHEGDDPATLLARGREEVAAYGVEVVETTVTSIDVTGDEVRVETADGTAHVARALVLATGVTDALPGIPGLAERWGTTILHCPYCHGWEVRDQRLAVLSTSPMAMHQVQLVRQLSDDVVMFTDTADLDDGARRRLTARGISLVDSPVVAIEGEGSAIGAIRTADGREHHADAIFTAGALRPHDNLVAHLHLARTESPLGAFLEADMTGRTSHPRIWAVGNVASPMDNVPMAIASGTRAGAFINAVLAAEDFDAAEKAGDWPEVAPAAYWEERYGDSERVWSGNPNHTLTAVATTLAPGRALDLGCGEGADAIWLAQQGWAVTGVDISPTAIARGQAAAAERGLGTDQVELVSHDLSTWDDEGERDLVVASFLHSPVALAREEILRRSAERVAPGGHLLVIAHAAPPPWSRHHHHEHTFRSAEEEVEALALDAERWETVIAEPRVRTSVGPDGHEATLEDIVVLQRRL